ncbi:MAG: transglutaminase domain-containing protein [Bacteroidetes bacterium]|nr:transglutaminase domain-containing protein [Bacteroidota bacterium]
MIFPSKISKTIIGAILITLVVTSCNNKKHFITDPLYRSKVDKQFLKQKDLAKNRQKELFDVFNQKITTEESEALKFLYAYMPLSDLAEFDGKFYLRNVRTSLKAKETFAWCKTMPEEIFRHFVLPIRVNNEKLDLARISFFEELKDRVTGLTMREAALEVNHWCHEKVIYKSTDGRTSSPLNTVKTAYGRCGEESTFTVAALRSVGIPARQCYTPRWAHSDDNHAWVEVWIDGKWHYIGACEPEPDLDMAWFTEPAKRAMLVNTNVFGDYKGSEEVLFKNEYYTKINLLANYTKTKTIYVKVTDKEKNEIDSAEVEFCLYNYAEFFPLSRRYTKSGIASFTTGLGDLMIWANYKGKFGFQKLTVSKTDTLNLVLDQTSNINGTFNYDLIPPVEQKVKQSISEKKKNTNSQRLKKEDEIRNAYVSTFIDSLKSLEIAKKVNLNKDSVWTILGKSRGNWKTIIDFLEIPSSYANWKLSLLYSVSEKDLHDISLETLNDHLEYSFVNNSNIDKANFISYVLCPRIGIEGATPYKKYLQNKFGSDFISKTRKDVNYLINWVKENIVINDIANYYNVQISPIGIMDLKVSDKTSRDIFFVGVCRSFGIPARIETSTKQPQYLLNGIWKNAVFEIQKKEVFEKGTVILENITNKKDFIPAYSIHYSLAVYKDGKYKTLDYEESPLLKEFPCKLDLNVGKYLLVTGNRQKDGSVLSSLNFFEVKANQTKNVQISLRESNSETKVQGKIDLNLSIKIDNKKVVKLSTLFSKNEIVLVWMDPEKEPTKHILEEIQTLRSKFETWNGTIVFLTKDGSDFVSFKPEKFKNLPKQRKIGVDEKLTLLKIVETAVKKDLNSLLPVVVIVNDNGEIRFLSSGYAIGTGEQIIKSLGCSNTCEK